MLEYNLNDMTISIKECEKITNRFINVIKNKALLSRTTPNALIYAKEAYGVCNLWERQLQMHSSNLLHRLNNKGILGLSTRIRLQYLQNLFWSREVVTESSNHVKTAKGQSLINEIIHICGLNNISYKLSHGIVDSLIIKGGNITIEEIIKQEDCYTRYRKSLHNRGLLYIEQLMSYNGTRLLHWQEIVGNN